MRKRYNHRLHTGPANSAGPVRRNVGLKKGGIPLAWTVQEIFNNEHITKPRKILAEYGFHLDGIPTQVRVRISQELKPPIPDCPFHFELSHYIHTPTQAGPYTTSRPWDTTESGALRRAVDCLLSYYKEAIQAGHSPDESWLVPNEYF
jgi:hypothetical protein